jgi:ParB/RepB/Spo0J family partition protein
MKISVHQIIPNPEQPRKEFDPIEMMSLAESIKLHGLLNPIAVEERADGAYTILDGERRWRAAQMAGLEEIEANVRPGLNGSGRLERSILAMVGNLQRADLNPIEEGRAYQHLVECGLKQSQIAEEVGVGGATVYLRLELLKFEVEIQELFAKKQLTQDWTLVKAIRELPNEIRVALIQKLAANGATSRGIVKVCKSVTKNYYEGKDMHLGKKGCSPAVELAGHEKNGWTMLELVSDFQKPISAVVTWQSILRAADGVCQDCSIQPVASVKNCRGCAAADLVRRLMI